MAEEEEEKGQAAEEQEAKPAASSSKKLYLIIAGVVVLVIAITVPLVIFMTGGEKEEVEMADADAAHQSLTPIEGFEDEDEYDDGEEPLGAIFPLETFVVNLSGGKYIRVQVQLEFQSRDIPRRFYTRAVPVRDSLIELLTTRTEEDVMTAKGKETLKEDIKEIINEVLRRNEVKNVYFTQFVVR